MRGFTERALVLLSGLHEFEESSPRYRYAYKQAVHNVLAYLSSVDIGHDCLITDALATHLNMEGARWMSTGTPEDMFYIKNYCSVPDYETVPPNEKLMKQTRGKYPIERGTPIVDRFIRVSKRIKYIESQLIQSYKFVVVFGKNFPVKAKEEDGRAILRINAKKFYTSLELSGEVVPINDFLQVDYASMCLCDWRI